ncbi:uncharacterized protein EV420DRAFT_1617867 [Desarmillaria tabescens]|uniref:Hyaluronan/mRNA-binding protein domain-containing protein n=1 Tax=Armillaria tabescens TaxID=1929756 RepID=A0AA39TSL5_ARMTA|nr:uncharacterized protein EV420DRAFT_1617867 [Desarmillaria tabescens]KAK0465133.1 hypothetical protein EV420DRAFT_1617867 [Desarmillaria tabescens]
MSVATKNPFALLDEDDARPTTPPPQPKQEPPAPASYSTKATRRSGIERVASITSAAVNLPQGIAPQPRTVLKIPCPQKASEIEGRGRGRGGRGGGRGGRGRPFDRQSQTGKTLGGDDGATELKQEEAAATDAVVEGSNEWGAPTAATGGEWGAPAPGGDAWEAPAGGDTTADAAAPADKPPRREREEEEDNTLTLDQYLAQQKSKEGILPQPEARKANEGAEARGGRKLLRRQGTLLLFHYFPGAKPSAKARAKKEEKVYLEIDARFDRPAPRGGARQGGGHNGNAPSVAPVVNVDDETAFPSLS